MPPIGFTARFPWVTFGGARPKKSVVEVYFPSRGRAFSYYNDRFDLHCGDFVYVEGKLEGQRGRVVEVNYNFRIRLSDYKRVIALAETEVHGRFFLLGSHFVTFDRAALPAKTAASWYVPPVGEDEEVVSGSDEQYFPLSDLSRMNAAAAIVERGQGYYRENRVRYLCVDGTEGYAIVEGTRAYEVCFTLREGNVSGLTCDCFCSFTCKHEVAAMLQLREVLEAIQTLEKERGEALGGEYFAAVSRETMFEFVLSGRKNREIVL